MWSLIPILILKISNFQLPPKSDSFFIQFMLNIYFVQLWHNSLIWSLDMPYCPVGKFIYLINNAAFWQRNRKKCTTLFFATLYYVGSYYFTIKGFKNKILYKNPCIFPPFSYIYYIFSLMNNNNKNLGNKITLQI